MSDKILQHFSWAHLPQHLQHASRPFCDLAHQISNTLPAGAERSTALRKLLEAKDAAVRAAIEATGPGFLPRAATADADGRAPSGIGQGAATTADVDPFTGKPLPAGSPYSSAAIPTRQAGEPVAATREQQISRHRTRLRELLEAERPDGELAAKQDAEQRLLQSANSNLTGEPAAQGVLDRVLAQTNLTGEVLANARAAYIAAGVDPVTGVRIKIGAEQDPLGAARDRTNSELDALTAFMRSQPLGTDPSSVLAALQHMIEQVYPSKIGTPSRLSQTGETYVEVLAHGVRLDPGELSMAQNEDTPIYAPTPEEAVAAWLANFINYARNRVGTLYWRATPTLSSCKLGWGVYSRLLITPQAENFVDDGAKVSE